MQRWHLTLLLAVQAASAAVFLPDWTRPPPVIVPTPAVGAPATQLAQAGTLTVHAGLEQGVVPAGQSVERYLVLTLNGERDADGPSRDFNVAVVLDRSGSMASAGKLDYARLASDTLLSALDERDRLALVTFSNHARVLSPSERVVSPDRIRERLAGLTAAGGTNLGAGLLEGLRQVAPHATGDTLDRIIVLSDGRVNQGETSVDTLASWAGAAGADGVTVSTIGLGLDYNEDLLARMADWGGGSYHFVDQPGALASIFQAELERMSSVAAEGVAIQVVPARGVEILDVLGYQHTAVPGGVSIPVGEVVAGEPRKVVLKVRVPAGIADSTVSVARVHVTRTDAPAPAALTVQAVASADPALLASSVDEGLAVLGSQAEASDLADKAVREWERGNVAGMRDLFASSSLVAGEAASRYGSEELARQMRGVEEDQESLEAAKPASREGRYQAILQKEGNRALAH